MIMHKRQSLTYAEFLEMMINFIEACWLYEGMTFTKPEDGYLVRDKFRGNEGQMLLYCHNRMLKLKRDLTNSQ